MIVGPVRLEVVHADRLDRATRAAIIALCEAAYGEDFTRVFDDFPAATHVLARDDSGAIVSHAEWVTRWLQPAGHPPLRTAYIEAVATAPPRQRRGLATAVLQHAASVLRSDPTWQIAALSPSDAAFYIRLGWELWEGPLAIRRGDEVEASPPDEQVMILRLPPTPEGLDPSAPLTAEWRPGELW